MKKGVKKIRHYLLIIILIPLGLVGLTIISYQFAYAQKIYPGVKLVGQPVGNQTRTEAQTIIQNFIRALLKNKKNLVITIDGQETEINLEEIKLDYRVKTGVDRAYQIGREKNFWQNNKQKVLVWQSGINLTLEYELDQNYLQEKIATLAAQIQIPAIEPVIEIDADQVIVNPGQPGQRLDFRLFRFLLDEKFKNLDFSPLKLPLLTVSPSLTENEIEKVTEEAEKLLGKKLTLVHENKTWDLKEKELINFLNFVGDYDRFKISRYVLQLAASVNQAPENARFKYENDRVIEFKPAQEGQALQQPETIDLIVNFLRKPEIEIILNLPIISTKPQVITADVNSLGIRELIGKGESWFKGSISSRIHNLSLASSKLNGKLIAPREIFSLNQTIGDVSETTGYKKAYIIKGGRTILGDGGGVCQVSTTLFRAALNAGLPIVERYPHAYRVSYYEQNSQAGLDATIYNPTADLKFQNDTSAYVLIQIKVDLAKKKLTLNFYGASDGRKATITKTRLWDQIPPPPGLYQDDPNLAVGTIKQIDWPAWGAKAAFDWKVTKNEKILQERTFYSHYKPWQAIYLVGTKPN